MATRVSETISITTTGVKTPATVVQFPLGGATVSLHAPAATEGSPVEVQVRAWNISAAKEVLATIRLPVPDGMKAGDLFDSVPVFSIWKNWDLNVLSVNGTVTAAIEGVTL